MPPVSAARRRVQRAAAPRAARTQRAAILKSVITDL